MIELLVALAVAAVLVAVAAPSFRDLVAANERDAALYGLQGDLRFARSEAIKRSTRVALCARASAAALTCSAAATPDWTLGWLIFTDDGATPGQVDAGSDDVMRVSAPMSEALAVETLARLGSGMQAPAARSFVRFGPRGATNWRGGGTFLLCDTEGDAARRNASAAAINLTMSGDVRQARRVGDDLINAFGVASSCPATPTG